MCPPTDAPLASQLTGLPNGPASWTQGWLQGARQLRSPNFGPRPGVPIDLLIVHAISLPAGVYGGPAIDALFTNGLDWDAHADFAAIRGLQVSAHFVIRRDGQLTQFVSVEDRAWHAGQSHWRGRDNCNDFSVGIELEGLDGQRFEDAQYRCLASLALALSRQWPIQEVVGHEHVAPARKRDPGAGFDWARLAQLTGWQSASPGLRCRPVHWGMPAGD